MLDYLDIARNILFSKDDLLFVIEKLREQFKETSETIPNYSEKEINEVYNCTERIFRTDYYLTEQEKYANLMFNITKGHFLSNGNKRTAVMVTLMYILVRQDIKELNAIELMIFLRDLVLKVTEGSMTKEQLCIEMKKYCK